MGQFLSDFIKAVCINIISQFLWYALGGGAVITVIFKLFKKVDWVNAIYRGIITVGVISVACIAYVIINVYQNDKTTQNKSHPDEKVGSISQQTYTYPQSWFVTEGRYGEYKSIWQIPSPGEKFPCIFTSPGQKDYIAKCIVVVADAGDFVAVSRSHSADTAYKDNQDCLYWGTRVGKAISGKYYCIATYNDLISHGVNTTISKSESPFNWSAVIQ